MPRIQIGTSSEAGNVQLPITHVPTSQPSAISNGPSTATTPEPVEAEFEFSDTNAMTCLLCARQFKNTDQLKRHNKESDLHKARVFIAFPALAYQMGLMTASFPLFCTLFAEYDSFKRNRKISRTQIYAMLHARKWKLHEKPLH